MSFSKVKRLSAFVCNSVILSNSVIRYMRLQIRTSSSDILDQYHHYKLCPSSFKNFISSCPWFLKSVIECSFHKPKHLWVPWPHQVTILTTNDHRMGYLVLLGVPMFLLPCHQRLPLHAISSTFMSPLSLMVCHQWQPMLKKLPLCHWWQPYSISLPLCH